ncbi:MAG TPA: aminopeptidase [Psychromonas hadalis]|nr:aminopeptidase [Psychromonas hadalis]
MSKDKKSALAYEAKNAWDNLVEGEREILETYCQHYMKFLSRAKTERLAHDAVVEEAELHGYRNMDDVIANKESLKTGDKVYMSTSGRTVMVVQIGKRPLEDGMRIIGGHTDAPRLDAKPNPLHEACDIALMDTHYYGGIRKYQWVTIPLSMFAVFVKKDGTRLNFNIGEDPKDPIFMISDLLPHLSKDHNKKPLNEAITGEDLKVIIGSEPVADKEASNRIKEHMLELLNEKYGLIEEDFISADIQFLPSGPARELGLDRAMIAGYGHDDRICSYAGAKALFDLTEIPEFTSCVILCDKEEIGSVGHTGMNSNIFENEMAELVNAVNGSFCGLTLKRAMRNSFMLSADVCAVHDPVHPEVSSPRNECMLSSGLNVSKYCGHAGKGGTTDASPEFMAKIRRIFDGAGVTWHVSELGKVDQGGGGTIAQFMAKYGMEVVDCGTGVLNMHAPYELASKVDTYMTYKGYKAFLEDKETY